MSTTRSLLRRVGGALAAGVVGLTMVVWALERTSLINFAMVIEGADVSTPMRVYVTMFVGLALVNLSTFYAVRQWSDYLREHPGTAQLPVWFLVILIVLPGAALITSVATHAGYIRGLDSVPMDPNPGFVGFQVIMSALIIVALVLLGVRWAPGYKRPQARPATD
ncbi:hypothetical protein [Demequina activiva]|uniref:Uncharacterized protein n=1 Tax=Demequina activiva TaxID=1582364 RepID=A0A919Q0Z4_9MICO|nr:hypothetical protein [Demequina activiva]GIG53282.1 hypothetical protein Dac01nite_00340 [Demequina activiva]